MKIKKIIAREFLILLGIIVLAGLTMLSLNIYSEILFKEISELKSREYKQGEELEFINRSIEELFTDWEKLRNDLCFPYERHQLYERAKKDPRSPAYKYNWSWDYFDREFYRRTYDFYSGSVRYGYYTGDYAQFKKTYFPIVVFNQPGRILEEYLTNKVNSDFRKFFKGLSHQERNRIMSRFIKASNFVDYVNKIKVDKNKLSRLESRKFIIESEIEDINNEIWDRRDKAFGQNEIQNIVIMILTILGIVVYPLRILIVLIIWSIKTLKS